MKSLPEHSRGADTEVRLFGYICRLLRSWDRRLFSDGNEAGFWQAVVRLASEQLVLTAITDAALNADGLPDMPADVAALLPSMTEANRARNLKLRANLIDASVQLRAAGIKSVAVKGAAFLAEDRDNAAPWRFFGDLDLLVREQDLQRAVSVLEAMGYAANRTAYHPHHHRHYPFLWHPDGSTGIDVHTRLAGLDQTVLLDPARFLETATETPPGTGGVFIPSATDRLAHLAVNAQILDYRFERRLFRLRDALDFADLAARPEADLDDIGHRFEHYGRPQALEPYLTMMGRVLGEAPADGRPHVSADRWVRQVERVICNPRRARLYIMKHWLRMALIQLSDRQERQFLVARLSDPSERAEFIAKRAAYFRVFQR